jgi:hypothetical protein
MLAVIRTTLATESILTGCGGLMAILFGVLTLMGGREWWLLAAAMAGAGAALFGVAAGLWGLRRRLPSRGLRWTIMLLAIQAVLIPAGWVLMGLGESAQPASGTDGPFVDGATGWMALAGFIYAYGGGVAVAATIWVYLRRKFRSI